ncbi:MAG: tRNA (adenosine(37)-N6)-threonylcarbamoyltransferase complex ATPase subunit type 1 TsaE [Pseudomonadota bacterium]|nr:tRNA (adenosine(37)-N6)-threonylcarbamoyltransferase complex ATPase subunit type 1 TsaE [Pseudomonadota bacterium]
MSVQYSKPWEYTYQSLDQLPIICSYICRLMDKHPNALIYFNGELGVGKTTLIKSIIRECGYKGLVTSPSYQIVNTYEIVDDIHIHHFDCYRLESPDELELMDVYQYRDAVCLVEWADHGMRSLFTPDIEVNLSFVDHDSDDRFVSIVYQLTS